MLNCGTGNGFGEPGGTYGYSQRPGIFALVADFYAVAGTGQHRGLLRDILGQIIDGLREQYESERRLPPGVRRSNREACEQIYTHVLAELQEFLDRAESEDEPVARLAHALDGLVIRQLRGEIRLAS